MFMRRVGRPGLLGAAVRTAVVAGTATAVSGAVAQRQHNRVVADQQATLQQQQEMEAAAEAAARNAMAAQPVQPVQPVPPVGTDLVGKLAQLGELRQQGLLADQEFEQAKSQLLGS